MLSPRSLRSIPYNRAPLPQLPGSVPTCRSPFTRVFWRIFSLGFVDDGGCGPVARNRVCGRSIMVLECDVSVIFCLKLTSDTTPPYQLLPRRRKLVTTSLLWILMWWSGKLASDPGCSLNSRMGASGKGLKNLVSEAI